ncbi:MAG: hypothetical protein CM1200mP18_07430 [Gammaproteobacteria bacterium]|nr:MAG: hypothetical protein CM1200mP18_07430 [Gammaproteobacteria bacterium]
MLRCRGEFNGVVFWVPRTVDFMIQNHLPGDLAQMGDTDFDGWSIAGEGVGFGLGFSVVLDSVQARTLCSVGEFSWGGMASTVFWVDPVEDITAMFLTQLTPSNTYSLRRELRVLVNQALVDRGKRFDEHMCWIEGRRADEQSQKQIDPAVLPLQGIRVVKFGTSVAAPYGTWILASLGAEVVKVERPGKGDDARYWGPPFWEETSTMFHTTIEKSAH